MAAAARSGASLACSRACSTLERSAVLTLVTQRPAAVVLAKGEKLPGQGPHRELARVRIEDGEARFLGRDRNPHDTCQP